MSRDLDELYQQIILEHNRKPRNFGELAGATHKAEGYNPMCGDHLWVELEIKDDCVEQVMFRGDGCAISKASASMMTTFLKGQSLEDAEKVIGQFMDMVRGQLDPEKQENDLGRLKIFSRIWQYPARVKCAALAWHAASGALDNKQQVSTEK